ncbi:hypothetical protein IW143_002624 [Coemansia sp. RSA 520]|nr:hypothetical protein IW143_002624 [Coemansia sp. RSA 520]
MASAGSSANANAAAKFWDYFQAEKTQITAHVAQNDVQNRVRELDSKVREALIYLPAYDQKQLTKELDGLRALVQKSNPASSRNTGFRFKTATARPSVAKQTVEEIVPVTEPVTNPTDHGSASTPSIMFSKIANQWIVATSNDNDATDCELRDISHCVVDLRAVSHHIRALNCHRMKDSIVICHPFAGSATIRDAQNSIVILGVQQLRFEGCKDVDVYTHCTSHPVIERSTSMRFSPYPAFVHSIEKSQPSLHDKIEDFNWLRRQHSPNWTLIDPETLHVLWKLLEDPKHPLHDALTHVPQ